MRLNVIITEGDIKNFIKVKKYDGYEYKTRASVIKALRNHLEVSSYTELSALDDDVEKNRRGFLVQGVPNTKAQLNIAMKAMDDSLNMLATYKLIKMKDWNLLGSNYPHPKELINAAQILRNGISKINKAKEKLKETEN